MASVVSLVPFVVAVPPALALVMASSGLGCVGSSISQEDDRAAALEQGATADDLALAKQALAQLGGEGGTCRGCHTATPENIRAWGKAMQVVDAACFATTTLSPKQRVDCLRITPSDSASDFSPRKLGFYAAGASFAQTRDLFKAAFPAAQWNARWTDFQNQVGMPQGGTPMDEAAFTKVKGWMLRGMPQLDQAIGGRSTADGGTADSCVESTTPELAAHLTAMRTQGWAARLNDQSTPMFGCGAAASPLACLTAQTDITAQVTAAGVVQTVRKLHEQPLASHYWVRSSADGRYVGFGLNTASIIKDLTKPATAPLIKVAAKYDPFFLPSNDGFAFAGAASDNTIRLCRQSLLGDIAGQTAPAVSLLEPKCSVVGRAVYQSIGSALDGARYFVTFGDHENDDGGHDVKAPLPANFGAGARTTFIPMVNDGAAYRAETPVQQSMPGEGDVVLSPSTKLLVDRFSGGAKQGGYRVRAVRAVAANGATAVETPLRAQVCLKGAKATFSFDERFLATHQYVDRSESDQAALPQGSSNIVVADLVTGKKVRLTKMNAGQYALYPHFRADGWLYFLVRDMNTRVEYVAATDVAVRLGAP